MRRRLPWVIWAFAIVLEIVDPFARLVNRSFQEYPFFLTVALS